MPIVKNHSFVKYFGSPFSPNELENWAATTSRKINGKVTFATCFISSELSKDALEIIEILQIFGQTNTVIGCTSASLVADNREIENEAGFIASIHSLPETEADALYFSPDDLSINGCVDAEKAGTHPRYSDYNAWLLFASSQRISSENWLTEWDKSTRGAVTVGGFANTGSEDQQCLLFHNGKIEEDGAVAVGLKGRVTIEPVISQGCRPVGTPWPVTKAELNIIHKVGNRPILEVLRDTLEDMSHVDKSLARGNIFIGLVLDEYKSTFGTGDFLVRNLAAIDPQSGSVAIATPPRVGQSMQFQIRDAQTAALDFEHLLRAAETKIGRRKLYGGCLVDCIGRGSSLYGVPNHDVSAIRSVFPGLSLSGLFCNGEFGPTNGLTRLHGYAASLGLFVDAE